MSERNVLVCSRVKDNDKPVPLSSYGVCAGCGEELWIAPSSRPYLDQLVTMCLPCAAAKMDQDDIAPDFKMLPGSLEELEELHERDG